MYEKIERDVISIAFIDDQLSACAAPINIPPEERSGTRGKAEYGKGIRAEPCAPLAGGLTNVPSSRVRT